MTNHISFLCFQWTIHPESTIKDSSGEITTGQDRLHSAHLFIVKALQVKASTKPTKTPILLTSTEIFLEHQI